MRHQASKNSPPGPADWRTLKKLGPYLWDHRWRFIFAVSFLIGAKVATIGVPIVLTYTATVYYIFRGKVRITKDSY